jgi:hypothetical protein
LTNRSFSFLILSNKTPKPQNPKTPASDLNRCMLSAKY